MVPRNIDINLSEDERWVAKISAYILTALLALYLLAGIKFRELGVPLDSEYFTLIPTTNRLRIVGIATSGILTFLLIYIYRNIGKIQQGQKNHLEEQKELQSDVNDLYQRQTDILDSQETWMKAEQSPELSVNSWEVDGEDIRIYLSNIGNGVAKDLNLEITIFPQQEDWPLDKEEIVLRSGLREENNIRAVQPTVEPKLFEGHPNVDFTDDGIGITDLAASYVGDKIEVIYTLEIQYQDLSDEEDSNEKEFWAGGSYVDNREMVLEGVINNTDERLLTKNSAVPPKSFSNEDK